MPEPCREIVDTLARDACFVNGNELLHKAHIDPDDLLRNFGILLGYFLVAAIISYYLTKYVVRTS